ncbi:hypothetical protein J7T55_002985 [Diaporthe amygdali]|uniref:uncharacterized protein n=1 Tax=Phomopsis amygdali TaxID=1214568 RepID=UPI0022FEFA8B|nr:uncharacterized protein J7T55_002985 [Diaporthe amygdali]KAJ0122472.1 hypothetical protein J7T55_002985 [Diaporthe amygdali]
MTTSSIVTMENFILIITAVMGGLVANAVGLSAPIGGYEIVNITWNIRPNISGATLSTSLERSRTSRTRSTARGLVYPLPTWSVKRYFWPITEVGRVNKGIAYLREVPDKPGLPPGPRQCGRVSCA